MKSRPRIDRLTIILGSMKSGTTSLYTLLNAHPDICGSREKEPMFFARPQVFDKGEDWYFDLWPEYQPGQIALEATTDYTKYPFVADVPTKLADFLSAHSIEPHFIFMMRDPLERIQSHLQHLYDVGADTIDLPQSFGSLDNGVVDRAIAYSSYALQLDQFRKVFPAHPVQLFNMSDLAKDPLSVVNQVCERLAIPALNQDDLPKKRAHNTRAGVAEWGHLPSFYEPLTENWAFKTFINPLFTPERKKRLRHLISSQPKPPRHALSDAERRAIARLLEPDLQRLHGDYGFDYLEAWPSLRQLLNGETPCPSQAP